MSNLLNLSDSINFAITTGRTPTFIYDNVTYSFSPQGLLDFVGANATPADVDWGDIDNVPETFPTTWDEVDDKPSTFASTWSQVGDKPTVFPSEWDEVDNKPSTFPAEAASVETAVANKTEIAALVSPGTDYADNVEITAAIKSIIDALKA